MRIKILFFLLIAATTIASFIHVSFRPFQTVDSNADAPPRGVYHVHTTASHDGQTKPDILRKTAKKMGLAFVIVTDHNTVAPISGDSTLTVLNYPELSTPFGHVVGFGLKTPLPKTLKENWLVLEEIQQRGGKAIIAHPSRRRNPWQGSWQPVGGVEIHNIASQLQQGIWQSLNILSPLLANRELGKARFFQKDKKALSRLDDFENPQVVGICANDSHGRLNLEHELGMWSLELTVPWPETGPEREFTAIHAIAAGRFYCVSSIIKHGGGFAFQAELESGEKLNPGQNAPRDKVRALTITAPNLQTDKASMILYRNGIAVAHSHKAGFRYPRPLAGTYRVEIRLAIPNPLWGEESIPVIYSNKIRVLK